MPPTRSRRRQEGQAGLILGLVAALALGGGGFYAVYAGIVDPTALLGGGGGTGTAAHGGEHGEAVARCPATSPSCRWSRS